MQKSSNFNWRALYGLLFISGALGTFGFCQDALAADSPTVEVLIGNQSAGASHEQTLKPTKTVGDAKIISVPVTIKMTGTSSYGVGVSLDCSGSANATECAKSALIGNDAAHTPLKSVTTPTAKGSLVNAWGFYSDGNNTTTPADNVLFKAIPTSANANNIIDNSQGTYNDGLSGGNGTKNLYLHFAAGVDGTQPSATYTGKIVVTAVAQPIDVFDWVITYNLDGGSGNFPEQKGTSPDGAGVVNQTVASSMPTKSGYTFKNWSDGQGKTYVPGSAIVLTADYNNVTLTAQWDMVLSGNMQDFTTAQCTAMATGTTAILNDSRTNYKYNIVKMKDNNCWMQQNLSLKGKGNTNIDTWNWQTKIAGTYRLPASTTSGWPTDGNGDGRFADGSHVDNTTDNYNTNSGSYFTFIAATAGTGTNSSGGTYVSICPKGWRLPSTDMFAALAKSYNTSNNPTSYDTILSGGIGTNFGTGEFTTSFGIPNANALPGRYVGTLGYTGTRGYYWSSSIYSATDGYSLDLGKDGGVYAQGLSSKYRGRAIRCVFSGQ